MAFRLYGKKFRSFKHAAAFAASKSGLEEKYARPTLELLERHFDGAPRKIQVQLAKALSNTIKWQPQRARRILRFIGRYVQASALTAPIDPSTHVPKRGSATRDHFRSIMLKLVQVGQGRATIRFARRHYSLADDVSKTHIIDALQLVAGYRGLPKKPDPKKWDRTRAERQEDAPEERDGPWFPEHADAIVRLAMKHTPAAEAPLRQRWVKAGLTAIQWSNTRPALDFVEVAYPHADEDARRTLAATLLLHGSDASAHRVMEIARRLNRHKDGQTRFLMALVLANVHSSARSNGHDELAEEAERRLNKMGIIRRIQ